MDLRLSLTPVVAIVGRPNVGKSTLFNRLIERRQAMVSAKAGTTTDLNYGHFHWRGLTATAIDTAGLDLTRAAATEEALKRQAKQAMTKADVIIFVVDATEGLNPQDRALAKYLQQSKKTVILTANKADNPRLRRLAEVPEWLKLGFGEASPISATNGSGTGDLLDRVYQEFRRQKLDSKPLPEIDVRIAIIGRPNVGKSSLLNALAGEERVIVSEVPFTTKEPQDTLLTVELEGGETKNILLIDTVGIRKKAHVEPGLEQVGVSLSLRAMERADVACLMVDATEGFGLQEKKLTGLVEASRVGTLIVVNKWDLAAAKNLGTADDYRKYLTMQVPFCAWSPVAFISAKTGDRTNRIIGYALQVAAERAKEIPQETLDAFVEKLKKIHHTAFARGQNRPKVYGITQIGIRPPTFMLVVKDKDSLHPNFLRFVENRLRDEFGFVGTPVRILAREITKGNKTAGH